MELANVVEKEYKEGFYVHSKDPNKSLFIFFKNGEPYLEGSKCVKNPAKEDLNKYEFVRYPKHYSKTNSGGGAEFIGERIKRFSAYEIIKFLDYEFY